MDITLSTTSTLFTEYYNAINVNGTGFNSSPLLTDPIDIQNWLTQYFLTLMQTKVVQARANKANANAISTATTTTQTQADTDFADVEQTITAIQTALNAKTTPPIQQGNT